MHPIDIDFKLTIVAVDFANELNPPFENHLILVYIHPDATGVIFKPVFIIIVFCPTDNFALQYYKSIVRQLFCLCY